MRHRSSSTQEKANAEENGDPSWITNLMGSTPPDRTAQNSTPLSKCHSSGNHSGEVFSQVSKDKLTAMDRVLVNVGKVD